MKAKVTSVEQRQANRRNALRSTGPKSPSGKRRSSGNARLHGLSSAGEAGTQDPLLSQLSQLSLLIEEDRIGPVLAKAIASNIVSYERNQAYQRELFVQSQEPSRSKAGVHQALHNVFGLQLDMMAGVRDEQDLPEHQHVYEHEHEREHQHEQLKARDPKIDLNFVFKAQHETLSLAVKQAQQHEKEQVERARQFFRYFKRSSNQLIKSIKSLRPS